MLADCPFFRSLRRVVPHGVSIPTMPTISFGGRMPQTQHEALKVRSTNDGLTVKRGSGK